MKYIISNTNKLSEFEDWLRNNTEILNSSSNLCEIVKHPIEELYAIPVVIDEHYFSDSILFEGDCIVDELPINFTWLFPLRTIRITIDNKEQIWHILNNTILGQLLIAMRTAMVDYTFIWETNTQVYAEELYPEHLYILEQYPDIVTIENLIIP